MLLKRTFYSKVLAKVLQQAELVSCNYPLCVNEAQRFVRSNYFKDLNYFKNYIEMVYSVKLRCTGV
jgi:hypothetical protein